MVKLWFPVEIKYLIDFSQINFIISSVKNFSNNETGASTVFSTGSCRIHLKPVESEMSEWIHLVTCCELLFFRRFAFWAGAFVAVSSLCPTITFPLRYFLSNTAELRSWLPLRLLVSTAVFPSPESFEKRSILDTLQDYKYLLFSSLWHISILKGEMIIEIWGVIFIYLVTLIWVGFLGKRLEVGWRGLKVPLPLCLEPIRIMLVETLTFGL